jgi:N-acetylmuramoyl-L-alanine amidase
MSKRVYIGVGHGGADPGAVSGSLHEADANLVMALELKAALDYHGVVTGISRTRDENDPLVEEIKEANAFTPDLAVECHNNAGGGDGFEVYYQTNGYTAQSLALAKAIEAEVVQIGQNSRGCKTKKNPDGSDYFGWCRQLKCPAVLCEGFFVDSADRNIADTIEEQKRFGLAYAKAVLKILGIPFKAAYSAAAKPTAPAPASKPIYRVQVGAFAVKKNSEATEKKLQSLGYRTIIQQDGSLYRVQVGAFEIRKNADAVAAKLKAQGFSTFITTFNG